MKTATWLPNWRRMQRRSRTVLRIASEVRSALPSSRHSPNATTSNQRDPTTSPSYSSDVSLAGLAPSWVRACWSVLASSLMEAGLFKNPRKPICSAFEGEIWSL